MCQGKVYINIFNHTTLYSVIVFYLLFALYLRHYHLIIGVYKYTKSTQKLYLLQGYLSAFQQYLPLYCQLNRRVCRALIIQNRYIFLRILQSKCYSLFLTFKALVLCIF